MIHWYNPSIDFSCSPAWILSTPDSPPCITARGKIKTDVQLGRLLLGLPDLCSLHFPPRSTAADSVPPAHPVPTQQCQQQCHQHPHPTAKAIQSLQAKLLRLLYSGVSADCSCLLESACIWQGFHSKQGRSPEVFSPSEQRSSHEIFCFINPQKPRGGEGGNQGQQHCLSEARQESGSPRPLLSL